MVVEPGYLLGPQGDEILIDSCVQVDLSRQGLDGNAASPCVPPVDPWCASTRVDLRIGQQLFIAAAYAECLSRPVRVQPAGCGCDDAELRVFPDPRRLRHPRPEQPARQLRSDAAAGQPPDVHRRGACVHCPACIADPWVLLASVTIRGSVISDNDIDNVTYRRHVISFADDYVLCGPKLVCVGPESQRRGRGEPVHGHGDLDRPAPQGDSYILLHNSDPTSATVPDNVIVPADEDSAHIPHRDDHRGAGRHRHDLGDAPGRHTVKAAANLGL